MSNLLAIDKLICPLDDDRNHIRPPWQLHSNGVDKWRRSNDAPLEAKTKLSRPKRNKIARMFYAFVDGKYNRMSLDIDGLDWIRNLHVCGWSMRTQLMIAISSTTEKKNCAPKKGHFLNTNKWTLSKLH